MLSLSNISTEQYGVVEMLRQAQHDVFIFLNTLLDYAASSGYGVLVLFSFCQQTQLTLIRWAQSV